MMSNAIVEEITHRLRTSADAWDRAMAAVVRFVLDLIGERIDPRDRESVEALVLALWRFVSTPVEPPRYATAPQ